MSAKSKQKTMEEQKAIGWITSVLAEMDERGEDRQVAEHLWNMIHKSITEELDFIWKNIQKSEKKKRKLHYYDGVTTYQITLQNYTIVECHFWSFAMRLFKNLIERSTFYMKKREEGITT